MAELMTPTKAEEFRNNLLAKREELQKRIEQMRTRDGGFDATEVRDGANNKTTEEALREAEKELKEMDEMLASNRRGAM